MDLEHEPHLIRSLEIRDLERTVTIDYKLTGRRRTAWFQQRLLRALSDSDVRISLGAESDGALVGVLLGSVHYGEFGLPEPVAVLDTILVDPDFSSRGIAHAMFEQVLKNLAALRITTLRTEVGWHEQQLLGFLAREGFAPVPRLVLERQL